MKGLRWLFWFLYKWLAAYTLIVFALVYWTPSSNWILGFAMLSFPVAVALNFAFLVFWLVVKPGKAVVPAMICLLSLVFLKRTFSFSGKAETESTKDDITVLSYNLSSFDVAKKASADEGGVQEMRKWIADTDADVLCMPEYVNNDGSKVQSHTRYFRERGYRHNRLYVTDRFQPSDYYGLALMSKYPIVYAKDTIFAARNGLVLADIKKGDDTIRVIAVHLYSMTLKLYTLVGQKEMDGLRRESRNTLSLMKKGFVQRAAEMETLHRWVQESPHPVIVCGDFNDTPYSYVYGKTREYLRNAFEEKGSGFGFTYNRLPYFIRIDHHFYDADKLTLVDFDTERSVKFSDHYPLIATYRVKQALK